MYLTNPLPNIPLTTIPPKTPRKLTSKVQSNITGTQIHTLKKDLSLDDPDTLTFHRDKLKEAQDALDKVRKTKIQDKLLSTVTQDVAHDVGPADHLHNSMWDYLKKYKNNHTTSSLPQTTRSTAIPDKRIWMKGPPPQLALLYIRPRPPPFPTPTLTLQ